MDGILLNLATLSGVTLALTQVVKMTFNVENRFSAGTALVIGIVFALIFIGPTRTAALQGILAALMASGLWGQVKTWAGQ